MKPNRKIKHSSDDPTDRPVVLHGPVDEDDVGDDRDRVAEDLPYDVRGVAGHPNPQSFFICLTLQKMSSSSISCS